MPPITMMPLIALVTLISGVCSAGVTFHTTCQPTMHASANTVRCDRNAGGATSPRPMNAKTPRIENAIAATPLFGFAVITPAGTFAAASFRSRRQRRGRPRRRRPQQLAVAQHQRAAHDFIGEIEVEVARAAQVGQQVRQVVAEQQARGRGQAARQIGVAEDVHAVALDHLAGLGQRAVAAVLRGQVDDHRAVLHRLAPSLR